MFFLSPVKFAKFELDPFASEPTNYVIVGGDGGCRVGEVRAGITSSMPDRKGLGSLRTLMLATVTVRDPPTPFLSAFEEIYFLRVKENEIENVSIVTEKLNKKFHSL